ncbi:MAG: glycoside hydrolase family 31 protein [Ketobacteraceae bacterium]|nr:glycoside hydrolase family 31 protein [Ketobacteraceae bacterium]
MKRIKTIKRATESSLLPVFALTSLLITVSGCSDSGAKFPEPDCTPGQTCFSDELSESGGTSGEGFPDPVAEDEWLVEGNNVSALVETKPFRISIRDGQGRTVLSSVTEPVPNYSPECLFYEPNAVGEFLASPEVYGHFCERYHPLHFEVGEPEKFQHLSLLYIDPMRIYRDTTLYFATDVIDVEQSGDGLLLTLATTRDNTTATVLIEPDPSGVQAMRVQATVNDPQVQHVNFAFQASPDETFYGFGGRRNMDQRGKDIYSWTEDSMAQNSLFPKISAPRAYGPQALFYSSRNYGFLVENTELSRFHMASDRDDAWKVNVSSNEAAFVVAAGTNAENIESITAINGRHKALPEWAKGFIFAHRSPIRLLGGARPGEYFENAMEHLKQLETLDIDTAGYLVEAWGSSANISSDELSRLIAEIKRQGIKPMTYMREMVVDGFLGTEDPEIFDHAVTQGFVPEREDGRPYIYFMWLSPTSVIDYTNPDTLVWWEQRLNAMLDLGSEGFMLDFGEQVHDGMIFHNGETGRSMHNKLSTLAAKETGRIVDQYESANPGRDIFYFTRSNFSGRPGSPAYEHAQFLGDNTQSWDALSGIKAVIPDILNRGLGGAYNVTTDIAGYWDMGKGVANKELFLRWTQLAAFVPVFRLHNSPMTELKTPWSFDDEALEVFKSVLELRKQALPYMNELWADAAESGMPLWRPMWLEFPEDPRFRNEAGQFMLGDRVLVAPVLDRRARKKSVALPRGCWEYRPTGQNYQGGGTVEVNAPLGVLPYFFKCDDRPF